jgi:hypothetical protein
MHAYRKLTVLRIAHNDVRFTVDQLSGEMYSAEFVRS